jgi:hypothetical protein
MKVASAGSPHGTAGGTAKQHRQRGKMVLIAAPASGRHRALPSAPACSGGANRVAARSGEPLARGVAVAAEPASPSGPRRTKWIGSRQCRRVEEQHAHYVERAQLMRTHPKVALRAGHRADAEPAWQRRRCPRCTPRRPHESGPIGKEIEPELGAVVAGNIARTPAGRRGRECGC